MEGNTNDLLQVNPKLLLVSSNVLHYALHRSGE